MLPEIEFVFPLHKESDSGMRVLALEQQAWERGESFPANMSDLLGLVRSNHVFSAKADEILILPPGSQVKRGLCLRVWGKIPLRRNGVRPEPV